MSDGRLDARSAMGVERGCSRCEDQATGRDARSGIVRAPERHELEPRTLWDCGKEFHEHGRHYFTLEDVQAVAAGMLAHRLIVRSEAKVEGKQARNFVRELLDTVPMLETRPRKMWK